MIWAKNTFTLGRSDYQRQYEPILYGWKDGTDHYWCGARDQGDVWFVDKPYAGAPGPEFRYRQPQNLSYQLPPSPADQRPDEPLNTGLLTRRTEHRLTR